MFNKILVPLDGSELAAKVLPFVLDLAKTHDSQVTLVYVFYVGESNTFPNWIEEAAAEERKSCELSLENAAKDLRAKGVKEVKVVCLEGSPAREIIAYAKDNGMDLIAMSTHGKGEVAWVLGSVAEKVVSHATVPVLLFRVILPKPLMFKEEYFEEVMERGLP
ncbi:MAG: universal stress protein [Deltaproteobacteria bacterium]|nr:MAG: universal stress protein [Deltaproteobacteria bacterium]